MSLDFARARRNPFFSLLALDKVEDSFLSLRQHTFRIAYDTGNASSNEQDPFSGAGRVRQPQLPCPLPMGVARIREEIPVEAGSAPRRSPRRVSRRRKGSLASTHLFHSADLSISVTTRS